ncbi:MAG: hypothetical protein Unbinned6316contig1000_18 [Prokaryotic dsDNA virus sp.]|nr:MAG: hypothetical protein Unbinned6316contig1000_18 [Prokaryotic dsDNA virus sp.]|tara:strand:- start:13225 stop:13806 length:582 start_codon:yes stop_codon:yes gene_type:complete
MNKIYIEISKLDKRFINIGLRYSSNKTSVRDAVQELMLYFLQMNPEVLENIYTKDGVDGIVRYGAVALRRFLTSKRSSFYYKYGKYYRNLAAGYVNDSSVRTSAQSQYNSSIYNLADDNTGTYQWEKLEEIDIELDKMNWYDRELFKLYYYESNTLDSLAKKTRISRNSLFTTIDKVRNLLKKKLDETIQSED